jgi:hypothetical protein
LNVNNIQKNRIYKILTCVLLRKNGRSIIGQEVYIEQSQKHSVLFQASQPITIGLLAELISCHEAMHSYPGQWLSEEYFWSQLASYITIVAQWINTLISALLLHSDIFAQKKLKVKMQSISKIFGFELLTY